MTADKGWTLEYVLSLTYRQFACLYERLWARKGWEIDLSLAMNPFVSREEKPDAPEASDVVHHDASTADGFLAAASALGIPVHTRVVES